MSRTVSPSSQQPYGVARVTTIWNRARSSFYAARHRHQHPQEPQKRGPKVLSDEELVAQIRELLAQPVFNGEGYLGPAPAQGHPYLQGPCPAFAREHQLLSPSRQPEPVPGNPHEGTIMTTALDQMWGTDATTTFTDTEDAVSVFLPSIIAPPNAWAMAPTYTHCAVQPVRSGTSQARR
jgi:hypothetical protein